MKRRPILSAQRGRQARDADGGYQRQFDESCETQPFGAHPTSDRVTRLGAGREEKREEKTQGPSVGELFHRTGGANLVILANTRRIVSNVSASAADTDLGPA